MDLALKLHGRPVIPVASCLGDGDTGGGLLYHNGTKWIVIDDVSTTGLFLYNNELVRILWAPSQVARSTSVLHYTREGFARRVTIEGLTDPHDVLWDRRHYVAVSSFLDSVIWFTVEGTVIKRFQPAQGADCWHLNSLLMRDGVLYATAFGRFDEPRGWVGHRSDGAGMLFRLDSGQDILRGLCCPHTPRFESSQWIVCNSVTSELRAFTGTTGEVVRSVQLQNWVRGLAISDTRMLVGESINRQLTEDIRGATVAVLDRKTWTVEGRLSLPFREVYDLVLVSPELLDGILRSQNARLAATCPPQIAVCHAG